MSPRGGKRTARRAASQAVASPAGPASSRDLVWPWAIVALVLWALFLTQPREVDPTLTDGAIVIGAVAATVATLLVLNRRNTQSVAEAAATAAVAAVQAQHAADARTAPPAHAAPAPPPHAAPAPPPTAALPPTAPPAGPPAVAPPVQPYVPPDAPIPWQQPAAAAPAAPASAAPATTPETRSHKGDQVRPCPCGSCEIQVEDANGYLTAVTAWVIAVDQLCKQASDAMVKGGWVHLPVYEFASDTDALKELLVRTCHEGGGTRAIWTIQGLVTVWEQTLLRVEQEIAATVEPGRYLAWHTATSDIRANRHGD